MNKRNKVLLFVMSFVMLLAVVFGTPTYAVLANRDNVNSNALLAQPVNIEIADRYEVMPGAPLPEDPTKYDDPALGGPLVFSGILQQTLLNIYRHYNPAYLGSYVCKNMFQYFTKLDLTNVGYGTSEKIQWGDFDYLYMPNLEELNLSNNGLETFSLTVLPGVEYNEEDKRYEVTAGSPAYTIKTLNLSGNKLTGDMDFTVMYELTNLNVSNNKLTGVKVNENQLNPCYLDYRNNLIDEKGDLVLPLLANTTLILYGNPFKVTTFDSNISLEIGLFNMGETITSTDRIKHVAFDSLDIVIKIYTKTVNSDNSVTYTEYNYNPNNLEDFEFSLAAGYYKIEYVDGTTSDVLSSNEVTVTPPMPTHYFLIKNEIYDTYTDKIKKGKIVINKDKNGNIANSNIKTYYRFNDSLEWIEGDEIDLREKSGTYSVFIKAVENGIESEVNVIYVQVAFSGFLPDVFIIILIIALMAGLGLGVLPLIKKFLDKTSK